MRRGRLTPSYGYASALDNRPERAACIDHMPTSFPKCTLSGDLQTPQIGVGESVVVEPSTIALPRRASKPAPKPSGIVAIPSRRESRLI
jgi:hypothetical protein